MAVLGPGALSCSISTPHTGLSHVLHPRRGEPGGSPLFAASPEKPGPCVRGAFLIYSQSKTRRRRGELATSCCLRLAAPRSPRGFLLRPRRSGGPCVSVPRGIKKESASKAELPPGTAGPRAGAGGQACEARSRGLGVRCPRLPPRSRPGARGTAPEGMATRPDASNCSCDDASQPSCWSSPFVRQFRIFLSRYLLEI